MNSMNATRVRPVTIVAACGMCAVMVCLLGRVVQLQLAPSAKLVEQQLKQSRIAVVNEQAIRGDVVDRRGRVLSATRLGYKAFVDPTILPEPLDEAIFKLAAAIGEESEVLAKPVLEAVAKNKLILDEEARIKEANKPKGFKEIVKVALRLNDPPDAPVAEDEKKPKLVKYLAIGKAGKLLNDEQAEAVRALRMRGVGLEQHERREYPGGIEIAPIVGLVGFDEKGLMGAELRLEKTLQGVDGTTKFVRDSGGRPLWIEPGHVVMPRHGNDARLTIDLEIQRICTQELTTAVEEYDAAGGRCVVVDPLTGDILAMVDFIRKPADAVPFPFEDASVPREKGKKGPELPRKRWLLTEQRPGTDTNPALAKNRCVEDVYEPGSTFKPFVWSTITELGLAQPSEVFNTHWGSWITPVGRPIKDVKELPDMTWAEVLINSSNIGMIQGGQRLNFKQLHDLADRFGFGKKTGLGLPGETNGLLTPLAKWTTFSQVSMSYGHEIGVTPVQMVRAFSAFCRPGELSGTLPKLRLVDADKDPSGGQSESVIYRVLPPDVADYTRAVMGQVAENMESKIALSELQHQQDVTEWKYIMFGKSGTAKASPPSAPKGKRRPASTPAYLERQYNSSFIAGAPLENPKLVCIVVIDDPGPKRVAANMYYGSLTAGPVVRRIMERSLTYLGVPPSPPKDEISLPQVPMRHPPNRPEPKKTQASKSAKPLNR